MKQTPAEQARELVNEYFKLLGGHNKIQDFDLWQKAKQCALIAVAEIKKCVINVKVPIYNYDKEMNYWNKVETEIKKL